MGMRFAIKLGTLLLAAMMANTAAAHDESIRGQTIQINTRLNSFVGRPIWTLIIRDVDNGIVYPYLYEFDHTHNFWLAFSYSDNYLITASELQIEGYNPCFNKFRNYRIHNFCHLESRGHIMRKRNMIITITGNLSPCDATYRCHIKLW